MAVHSLANLGLAGFWHLGEQFGTFDDHSVVAIAALRRLLVDHGLLERVQRRRDRETALPGIERWQPLKRGHCFSFDGAA
jgi:hypothetical protein